MSARSAPSAKPAKPAELEPPEPVRTDEPHDEPSTGQSGHIRTETHNPSRESEAVRRCSGGAGSEEGAFSQVVAGAVLAAGQH